MTADEFRATLGRLGFSQGGLASFLLVEARTVRRWATGELAPPQSVVLLLGLMDRFGLSADDFA